MRALDLYETFSSVTNCDIFIYLPVYASIARWGVNFKPFGSPISSSIAGQSPLVHFMTDVPRPLAPFQGEVARASRPCLTPAAVDCRRCNYSELLDLLGDWCRNMTQAEIEATRLAELYIVWCKDNQKPVRKMNRNFMRSVLLTVTR